MLQQDQSHLSIPKIFRLPSSTVVAVVVVFFVVVVVVVVLFFVFLFFHPTNSHFGEYR